MSIRLENVTHTYMPGSTNERVALAGVSLCIEEGEFWGIIGHTGSGKSTLVQHMNGLMQPTTGTVFVDDMNLADKKLRMKARSRVGLVFQYPEYQLFEETVEKDIAFGPKNLGVPETEIPERVREAIELVGLSFEQFAKKSPFDLSGGEKRRVALAGILAMRPRYLLLDEPMAGLDPRGRQNIIDMLHGLRKNTGRAVVIISHSMDDIARNADKILVLRQGRMEAADTPARIFARPEWLLELGLDLPQAAQLAVALRAKNVDIPQNIYREEDLLAYLKGVLA